LKFRTLVAFAGTMAGCKYFPLGGDWEDQQPPLFITASPPYLWN